MIKKLRKIGRVKPATVEKTGKPGKPVIVKKLVKAKPLQGEILAPRGKPDPGFVEFFSADYKVKSEWDLLLGSVIVPGMPDASWDRKAAYLYYKLRKDNLS